MNAWGRGTPGRGWLSKGLEVRPPTVSEASSLGVQGRGAEKRSERQSRGRLAKEEVMGGSVQSKSNSGPTAVKSGSFCRV